MLPASYPIARVPANFRASASSSEGIDSAKEIHPNRELGSQAMWNLRQLVDRYFVLAGGYGKPVALGRFALTAAETLTVFGSFDEDYHISRYLHFSKQEGNSYLIGGEQVTHLSIDESIKEIL